MAALPARSPASTAPSSSTAFRAGAGAAPSISRCTRAAAASGRRSRSFRRRLRRPAIPGRGRRIRPGAACRADPAGAGRSMRTGGETPCSCPGTPREPRPAPRSPAPADPPSRAWRRGPGRPWAVSGCRSPGARPIRRFLPRARSTRCRRCRLPALPDADFTAVSAAGLAPAVPPWLEEWRPRRILCGYDADAAGDAAAERLCRADGRAARLRPGAEGADWNDLLPRLRSGCGTASSRCRSP